LFLLFCFLSPFLYSPHERFVWRIYGWNSSKMLIADKFWKGYGLNRVVPFYV
jgi:hypothetical protein